ncbi:E3 ubiquitin/ISG15 ligase TRIM25 [Xenopus laevis]|uniref:E3 ubiquitin/ISG15 ligase TRIM25 n=1 Tax=Xenopus laevis TaxID=8355 RepID=A0A8J1LZI0_XENLA|nr:E3 ubiquitin/ISG15 ligase TRIM25 [Xenopus laevis]
MAAANLRDELNCSICLSIYTDPVSLPCGHNFCRNCIGRTWDIQEDTFLETPSCPECRRRFKGRSGLTTDWKLRGIVEQFLSTHPEQDGTGIFCTYCVHSPVPAAKSCLQCEVSMCDAHVRVHSKSAEHVLTEPTASLGNRKCSAHNELLKYYCCEDGACICVSCCLAGEHRGHRVELLNEASEKKKEKLRNVLEKLGPERKETERRAQRLQEHRREVSEKAVDETERISALFRDIREQLEALEKRLLSDISRQNEELSLQLWELIQQLEIKKNELSRKIRHIEELCNMADPLTVLQERESDGTAFCGAEGADNEDRERDDINDPVVGDLDVDLISETLLTGLSGIVTGVKAKLIPGQEATDLLLDTNTAGNHVSISGDRKSASCSHTGQCHPQSSERFQYPQVLSTRSFRSGRHYWEVEVSELGQWRVGVAYPSTDKGGDQSCIGNNKKSWCLCGFSNYNYTVKHEGKTTNLPHSPSCRRIRISLDYEAGRLSFYELSEPVRHLHTFTASFTEPLHAAFFLWGISSWVRIIS